jgi:hypothetical protein
MNYGASANEQYWEIMVGPTEGGYLDYVNAPPAPPSASGAARRSRGVPGSHAFALGQPGHEPDLEYQISLGADNPIEPRPGKLVQLVERAFWPATSAFMTTFFTVRLASLVRRA